MRLLHQLADLLGVDPEPDQVEAAVRLALACSVCGGAGDPCDCGDGSRASEVAVLRRDLLELRQRELAGAAAAAPPLERIDALLRSGRTLRLSRDRVAVARPDGSNADYPDLHALLEAE